MLFVVVVVNVIVIVMTASVNHSRIFPSKHLSNLSDSCSSKNNSFM